MHRMIIRLPKELWEYFRDWAKSEDRSINSLILRVLKDARERRERNA